MASTQGHDVTIVNINLPSDQFRRWPSGTWDT